MKRMASRWIPFWTAAALVVGCSRGSDTGSSETAAGGGTPSAATQAPAAAPADEGPLVFSGRDTLWNSNVSLGEPVARFGDEDASWTASTLHAADRGTTGRPATVVGEVVDVSCYLQLGKRGEAHIPCGTDCVRNGAPIGVVDAQNRLYIVMPEEHDPRRYGKVALKEAMLPFMAKTVAVTGMLTERDGVNTLYVLGYAMDDDNAVPSGQ